MDKSFTIENGFDDTQRNRVAKLYWLAFSRKLGGILGPEARALPFLSCVVDPRYAISARAADGTVLGVAGFKTRDGGFLSGGAAALVASYGRVGAVWRGALLSLLDRTPPGDLLLMDGIFVAPQARGLGVGTALLDAIQNEAAARGLAGVRLDVVDTNPRAAALYRRVGFTSQKTESAWPFHRLFGFNSSTRMERRHDASGATALGGK